MSQQAKKSQRELAANVTASFATGVTIISFTNPTDTLKCRWQVLGQSGQQTFWGYTRTVLAEEGLWAGLWRPGLPPNQLAMGCAIGGRNGFYPIVRDTLGYLTADSSGKVGPTGMFVAGLLAGMCGYAVATPLLQIKTQMQAEAGRLGPDGVYETGVRAGQAPTYRNSFHAVRSIMDSGGVFALWRGASVIVGRGAVLSASQLMAYDGTKTEAKKRGLLSDGPLLHVVASVNAAVVCTTMSMPLDVVLTVYQSSHSLGGERLEKYGRSGPVGCAAALLRESGPTVFMRGWTAALMRLAPTCVASFWLYEQLRRLVGIGFLD
eukprot:TRINITY_DN94501_c0_g1_i1.p1 TRINITY_DN94501_c0_g1~~TRINITY_DN94501_c0_g1_i1.p1  ORF type:complete len:321 (+),score=57.13 TRINITY_DN94501_c0_g1_i1:46-1008(+)